MRILQTTLFCLAWIASVAAAGPWTSPYPDMRAFRLQKPDGFVPLRLSDWEPDLNQMKNKKGVRDIFGSPEQVFQEAKGMVAAKSRLLDYVNKWSPGKPNSMHYGQTFCDTMNIAARIYFMSGEPRLGRYIHDYTLHAATLPDWFWYGESTLKPLYAKGVKTASLITAHLAQTTALVLSLAPDLFSPEEKKLLEDVFRRNCHESSVRFIRRAKGRASNWNAVIAGGLLISSKYFHDAPSLEMALNELENYASRGLESDGSYGEGLGYFYYGYSQFSRTYDRMTQAERERVFRNSPLRRSPEWIVYHYYNNMPDPGQRFNYKAVFQDANYFTSMPGELRKIFVSFYNDPIIKLGLETLRGPAPDVLKALPTVRGFLNGTCFIRSSWEPDAAVLAAHLNIPVKADGHRRPENGNFSFAVNGLPLVMHAGNTNLYRRPIHLNYAARTASANTVAIAGTDQRLPPSGRSRNRILAVRKGQYADLIAFEMADAFSQKLQSARRCFLLLKPSRTLVVLDRIAGVDKPCKIETNLNFNNIDHNASMTPEGKSWLYAHPKQSMRIFHGGNIPLKTECSKAYIVSGRYSHWDEAAQTKEAQRGNGFRLTCRTEGTVQNAFLYTVLSSMLQEPDPQLTDGELVVEDLKIKADFNGIRLYHKKGIEQFQYE